MGAQTELKDLLAESGRCKRGFHRERVREKAARNAMWKERGKIGGLCRVDMEL